MNIKKNDTVLIITGKDAKKTGKVLSVNPSDNRIKVEGVNVQMKSKKARSANETSAIVPQVGPIDASNAMVICPACGKATRVAHAIVDGKKVRVCKKCGGALDVSAEAKKVAKKSAKKASDTEKTVAEEKPAKKTTAKKTADKKD